MTYQEFTKRLDELMDPVLDLVASVQVEDCKETAKAELLIMIDKLKESYGEILED